MNDTIYSINGPVVTLRGARGFSMMEMVYVGEVGLIARITASLGKNDHPGV